MGSAAEPAARRPPPALVGVALLVGAVFAAPLGYLVVRSAGSTDILDVVGSRRTALPLARSLVLASSVAVAAGALGTTLAWLTVRTDLPGRRAWRALAPLPLVIPSFVGASALLAAFTQGGLLDELLTPVGVSRLPEVRGFWGAFAVLTLLTYPYVLLPVAARLGGLPASLEESARLLGHRPAQVFARVVLPQISPAIGAGTLLVFLYAISDFGAVSLMRYRTLTEQIFAARLQPDLGLALGLVLGLMAVVIVALERLVNRRRRVPVATVRGGRALVVPLGRWRWPGVTLVALVALASLAAPVVVLGHWAIRGLSGATSRLSVAGDLDVGGLAAPALNTAVIGVVTAVIAVVAVLPVAFLVVRHRSRAGTAATTLVTGGFALPGLVIALALVFWTLQAPALGPLYQSFPLLVLAYVVHFGAQAMQAGTVAVGAVPVHYGDVARTLGAGRVRRVAAVELPLMLPGLLAGGGLVLLSTMKELPATLLLAPIGFETLATRVWQAAADGFLAEAGLVSLALIALSGVLTWALVIRRAQQVW